MTEREVGACPHCRLPNYSKTTLFQYTSANVGIKCPGCGLVARAWDWMRLDWQTEYVKFHGPRLIP